MCAKAIKDMADFYHEKGKEDKFETTMEKIQKKIMKELKVDDTDSE
jgi:hypothetical protein